MRSLQSGPRVVVTAPEPLARKLSNRLWDLPSIGRIRGSLVVRPDDQDPVYDTPDVLVCLSDQSETDAYYHVLGRMAELGMIAGRGVPIPRAA